MLRYWGNAKLRKCSSEPFVIATSPSQTPVAQQSPTQGEQLCPELLLPEAAHLRVLELRVEREEDVQGLDPALVHGDVQDGCR